MKIMKNSCLLLLVSVLGISAVAQQKNSPSPNSRKSVSAAAIPVERTDKNSQTAHEQLLEKAVNEKIDVYFLGDSITRRWGSSDAAYAKLLSNWRENFFGWNAADFGWGGDMTQNILWRIENGELDNVNPKVVVLLAGTNNIGSESPTVEPDPRVEDVPQGIKAILETVRRKAPGATIILMGITPRNDNLKVLPVIEAVNKKIAKLADGKKIRYLNINEKLADKNGKLLPGMTFADNLHLDIKGCQIWADALKPIFRKLLGAPAKEDFAPPPTGDPGAVKK